MTDDGLPTSPGYVPPVTAAWSLLGRPGVGHVRQRVEPDDHRHVRRGRRLHAAADGDRGRVEHDRQRGHHGRGRSADARRGVRSRRRRARPFAGVVARFTDADPNGTAGQFSATIDWGDGQTSAGVVAANGGGGFDVREDPGSSHTYAATGPYAVSVTVTDVDGASATSTAPPTCRSRRPTRRRRPRGPRS